MLESMENTSGSEEIELMLNALIESATSGLQPSKIAHDIEPLLEFR